MKRIAEFILEACFLKQIPRSGYQYLGVGRESVAEHVYCTIMIAFIFSQLEPRADMRRLLAMCLMHDLPEARLGDLNYVQKRYLEAREGKALEDALDALPFAEAIENLIAEFNTGETLEARLARDADQLALIVDLKRLRHVGYQTPETWLPNVRQRLQTETGRKVADQIVDLDYDDWWRKLFY